MLNLFTPFFRRFKAAGAPALGRTPLRDAASGRSVSHTGLLLKKQLWIWPIIAVILLAGIGYGVHAAIERTMQASLQSQLTTLLNVQRTMLETWLQIQESNAQSLANDPQVRDVAAQLVATTESAGDSVHGKDSETKLPSSPNPTVLQNQLTQELAAGMSAHHFIRYILVDRELRVLAASNPEFLGRLMPEY